jgi:hypothetical protein
MSLSEVLIMEYLPQAAAIWMILLLVVALAVAVMAAPGRPATAVGTLSPVPPPDPGATDPSPADDLRYWGEVATAADRAAVIAQRRRAEWQEAQAAVDAAWAAYDEADRAARRTAAATAYPVMRRRRAAGENAERERYLHRAATAACRNREISIAQLNDALAHRGWNPRLHPAAQESALRNAARDHRYAAYLAATEREQRAWTEAEQAAEALRSLRAEACAAPLRRSEDTLAADAGWWAEQWATAEPVRTAAA